MKVSVLYRNDPERPLTDPLPDEAPGWLWVHRVYAGDFLDPLFGNWFTAPWPIIVVRLNLAKAHFFAWRIPLGFGWHWLGYAGFKLYGADSSAYLNWMPMKAVHGGSQALCWSLRPFVFRRIK